MPGTSGRVCNNNQDQEEEEEEEKDDNDGADYDDADCTHEDRHCNV